MSDEASHDEPQDARRADLPVPLGRIVDDLTPREEAADWLYDAMIEGASPDDLKEDLVNGGWTEDDAAELVEFVRRHTREERGVVTREDVTRKINRRYRRSMASWWFIGFPVVAAAFRLMHSGANLLTLRRKRRPPTGTGDRIDSPPDIIR